MKHVANGRTKVTYELDPLTVSYLDFLVKEGEYRSRGKAIDDIIGMIRQGGYIIGNPKYELACYMMKEGRKVRAYELSPVR